MSTIIAFNIPKVQHHMKYVQMWNKCFSGARGPWGPQWVRLTDQMGPHMGVAKSA